jgi:hypothetical protein
LNSGPTPWTTPPALFVMGFFKIGSCKLFSWGRFEPLSSLAARVTGVSHQHSAVFCFWNRVLLPFYPDCLQTQDCLASVSRVAGIIVATTTLGSLLYLNEIFFPIFILEMRWLRTGEIKHLPR